MPALTTEQFIEKARKVHGNTYNYDRVVYVKAKIKVEIICPLHGSFFQCPDNHYMYGCMKCGRIRTANCRRITTKYFIIKANLIHNNKYIYKISKYINNRTKIEIICTLHGSFWQEPSSHFNGSGCPKCLYKNETACREAIEKITGKLFPKIKPKFLEGLEYDMYNEDMKIAIEYDGEQHTKPIKKFGGEKKFQQVQKNDKKKRKIIKIK